MYKHDCYCGLNTYHNNIPYGTCARPVKFTEIERIKIGCEWVDVLTANREFFERIRCGCEKYHVFYADICPCIAWNDSSAVYLSDGTSCKTRRYEKHFSNEDCCYDDVRNNENGIATIPDVDYVNENGLDMPCRKLIKLETCGGFRVRADQIQPYAGSHKLIKMVAAYDPHNLKVKILSPILPAHRACECNELKIYDELGYR